ncbi:MAG: hypothetical protein HN341_15190 [Verrucomicrobia bacterium]|jgi:hypothetical protein|nr:hypothetical protein [Verrucomicrobiota bacterium]
MSDNSEVSQAAAAITEAFARRGRELLEIFRGVAQFEDEESIEGLRKGCPLATGRHTLKMMELLVAFDESLDEEERRKICIEASGVLLDREERETATEALVRQLKRALARLSHLKEELVDMSPGIEVSGLSCRESEIGIAFRDVGLGALPLFLQLLELRLDHDEADWWKEGTDDGTPIDRNGWRYVLEIADDGPESEGGRRYVETQLQPQQEESAPSFKWADGGDIPEDATCLGFHVLFPAIQYLEIIKAISLDAPGPDGSDALE